MALNLPAFYTEVIALLTAATGVQNVARGAPESWSNVVTVYASIAGQRMDPTAPAGVIWRWSDIWVEFGYRVKGAEATAENTLAAYVDSVTTGFYAARNTRFNSTVDDARIDLALASTPDYLRVAAQEIRTYPLLISGKQSANY
jgi:hypothetical protein